MRLSKLQRRSLAVACCVAGCAKPAPQLDPARVLPVASCPPLVAPQLVFQSDFWLNLHNFLYKEAKRRERVDDDGAGAAGNLRADTLGVRALTAAEQRRWDAALAYYTREVLSDRMGMGDSLVTRVNDRLAAAPEESLEGARLDSTLAMTLAGVAPIYRAVWWPIQNRHNEAWISASRGLVDRYGGCVFPELARLLERQWPAEPIVIHATTYASWFGAYTTTATGPNVTISTNAIGNQETYALESILHESAHAGLLLQTGDSVMSHDAASRGIALGPDLSHLVLFYTAGEIVSRVIPTHVPYAERFGIWSRNSEMERLQGVLADTWKPYLAGRTPFEQALDAIVVRSRR